MLLRCSWESSPSLLRNLTDSRPVRPGTGAGGICMEARALVQKRCGVRNEELQDSSTKEWGELTVCSNHELLLTNQFPVRHVCQGCSVQLPAPSSSPSNPAKVITAMIQDIFSPYLEGFVTGQAVCDECRKKVIYCQTKRKKAKSERELVQMLAQTGLISESKMESWQGEMEEAVVAKRRKREEREEQREDGGSPNKEKMPAEKVWAALDTGSLELLPVSAVPPLRFLARGLLNGRRLGQSSSAPEITVREAVELSSAQRLSNYGTSLTGRRRTLVERLARLGLADGVGGIYELLKLGSTFRIFLQKHASDRAQELSKYVTEVPLSIP